MAHTITLRGEAADVRHVYHRAASLGSWRIESGHLTAQIRTSDPFRLSQSPLTFCVLRPNGHTWTWPLEHVVVSGEELQATVLSPAEEATV